MKWTKFVGTVTAMLCGLSACVPFTAAAEGLFPEPDSLNTIYNSADINRSGSVDITDSTILSQYLLGHRYVAQPKYMDVDNNKVVSAVDRKAVLAKMVDTTYSNYVDGYSLSFHPYSTTNIYTPSSQQVSEGYYIHNFQTNTTTTTPYTLSLQESSFPTSIASPDETIGTNDLENETEPDLISGICRFSTGGTGFVVGDHLIATAAHCIVSDHAWRGVGLYVQFPDSNGYIDANNATKYYVVEGHVPESIYNYNFNNGSYVSSDDYALIYVDDSLSDNYHFSLGVPYNYYTAPMFSSYDIYVTGFSQPTLQSMYHLFTGNDKFCTTYGQQANVLRYFTDTNGGGSGSPVYIIEDYTAGTDSDYTYTVIGIHNTVGVDNNNNPIYNAGAAMRPIMLRFYLANTNIGSTIN